ncbi:MAG TPA: class I SAM-dependent methyltransferase [Thermomicrobiales bacterium]|nr:class I SAM-dependent methyltransferase [Thermomicrobiales bacterium]
MAYDRIAADYAVRNAAMPPALIELGGRLLERTGPGARVLDAGCGVGRDMAWLEAHGARVIGVDISAGMLAEARTRASGPLLRLDMRSLAFADDSFDGVWCVASLLHLPKSDVPPTLAEFHRVLVPGGTIVLSLQHGAGEEWERDPYGKGTRRFFARYSLGEATTLLTGAGFMVIERGSDVARARHWLSFLATA